MRARYALWLAALGFLVMPVAQATPSPIAQTEISYLLTQLATSPCQFNRNGHWYEGRQAAAHLEEKYHSPFVWGHIGSAEEFIDKVATRSSISGVEYAVRCGGAGTVSSALWLRDQLGAFRRASEKPRSP